MNKIIVIFVAFLAVLSMFTGLGIAEETRKTMTYPGMVQDIDLKGGKIVVGKEGRTLGMLFTATKTNFTNVKGLQNLKPGDKVVVEYDAVRGETIAVSITRR